MGNVVSDQQLRLEQCRRSQSQNPFCGTDWARVRDDAPLPWQRGLVGEMPCARAGEGYPLLLDHQPDLFGRYEIVAPELARWCPVYRMVEWPLPRYSSHLVDCPVLIARRLEEAEIRMEQMRYAAERRKNNREAKKRRMEAWEARFEDPFGKEA